MCSQLYFENHFQNGFHDQAPEGMLFEEGNYNLNTVLEELERRSQNRPCYTNATEYWSLDSYKNIFDEEIQQEEAEGAQQKNWIEKIPPQTRELLELIPMIDVNERSCLFDKPFENGWKRMLSIRSCPTRKIDAYYYTPDNKRIRSMKELERYLLKVKILTLENFTFARVRIAQPPFELVNQVIRALF